MDEKSILNNGFGSPGETARVMTKKFLKLKENSNLDAYELFTEFLTTRALTYKAMGFDIFNPDIIKEIAICHNDRFPFVILADIYLTNKVQGPDHLKALSQNLEIVTDVVVENYNSLVPPSDRIEDIKDLILDIELFINSNETPLKFNILYVYQQENCASCLKFISSTDVIYVDIEGDVLHTKSNQENINSWFNHEYHDSRGLFRVEFNANEFINEIDFSIKTKSGFVSYSGEVFHDRLEVRIFDENTKREAPKIIFYLIP